MKFDADIDVLAESYGKDFNRLYEIIDWKISTSTRRIKIKDKDEYYETSELETHFHLSAQAKRLLPKETYALDSEIEVRIYPMEEETSKVGFLGVSINLDMPKKQIELMSNVLPKLKYMYLLTDIPCETLREARIHRVDFETERQKYDF